MLQPVAILHNGRLWRIFKTMKNAATMHGVALQIVGNKNRDAVESQTHTNVDGTSAKAQRIERLETSEREITNKHIQPEYMALKY